VGQEQPDEGRAKAKTGRRQLACRHQLIDKLKSARQVAQSRHELGIQEAKLK
jgi:hypothetical protein